MAIVNNLFIREWLNEDEGSAYVFIDAEKEDTYKYVSCNIEIKDCTKQIVLEFDYHDKDSQQKRLDKVSKLISHLESVRTFIENNPSPTPEEIKAAKASEKNNKEE